MQSQREIAKKRGDALNTKEWNEQNIQEKKAHNRESMSNYYVTHIFTIFSIFVSYITFIFVTIPLLMPKNDFTGWACGCKRAPESPTL